MSKVEIQLLSDRLPAENPHILAEIDLLRQGLFKDIGWHYYVDLIWVILQLQQSGLKPGSTILDAGAGSGLLQFLLSYYGYHVLSVDFAPRKIPFYIRKLFPIETLSTAATSHEHYVAHMALARSRYNLIRKLWLYSVNQKFQLSSWFRLKRALSSHEPRPGKVTIIQNDMRQMRQVTSQSVDAVVSVSAVEHMEPDQLPFVINEFARVMKPEAGLILTTNASGTDQSWFHEPSQGWCYSLASIEAWFTNCSKSKGYFTDYSILLEDYQKNDFLRQRLAQFHYFSANNGMPNGVWNPVYIPVGVKAQRNDLIVQHSISGTQNA